MRLFCLSILLFLTVRFLKITLASYRIGLKVESLKYPLKTMKFVSQFSKRIFVNSELIVRFVSSC